MVHTDNNPNQRPSPEQQLGDICHELSCLQRERLVSWTHHVKDSLTQQAVAARVALYTNSPGWFESIPVFDLTEHEHFIRPRAPHAAGPGATQSADLPLSMISESWLKPEARELMESLRRLGHNPQLRVESPKDYPHITLTCIVIPNPSTTIRFVDPEAETLRNIPRFRIDDTQLASEFASRIVNVLSQAPQLAARSTRLYELIPGVDYSPSTQLGRPLLPGFTQTLVEQLQNEGVRVSMEFSGSPVNQSDNYDLHVGGC